jgi:ATP phosphoribosyltransferase regulatory subunit
MTAMPTLLPEGFRDRLPPFAAAGARMESAILALLHSHGYDRVDPPLAEFEASLTQGLPADAARNLLRMIDPISQDMLALRADLTMQVGRIASGPLAAAPRPLRLSYAGQTLRLRAGQLRPERVRHQIGAELIGADNIAACRETATLAIAALRSAGVGAISMDITMPDAVDILASGPLPLAADLRERVKAELDMKDAGALTALGAAGYLPLIEATGPLAQATQRLRAFDRLRLLTSRLDGIEQIAAALPDDVRVTLDPTERHGFAYHSWFGFALYADICPGTLGRGGSYRVGVDEVATGFSLYPDLLIEAGLGIAEERRLFLPWEHDPAAAADYRAQGWRTIAAVRGSDDGQTSGCSHILRGGRIEPLAR